MKSSYKKYWEGQLNNNCPECFSNTGLTFSFMQKHDENAFIKRSTKDVKSELHCSVCNNQIYPSQWTDDIERVYDYNYKLAELPKPYYHFKPLTGFIFLGLALASIAAAVVIYKMQ